MRNSVYEKLINIKVFRNWCTLYLHLVFKKVLKLKRRSKYQNFKFKEKGENPEQNIWNKVKKSYKIGQKQKTFAPILTPAIKVLFL